MAAAAGLVAGEVVVVFGARGWRRAGGFAYGVGQRDEVVRGGGWRREVAVVADQIPASGGSEAAGVRFAEIVCVGLGEGGQRADHRGGVVVDVGQGGDRLSGTAVPGAAPW